MDLRVSPSADPDIREETFDWDESSLYLDAEERENTRGAIAHAGPWLASGPIRVRNVSQMRVKFEPGQIRPAVLVP